MALIAIPSHLVPPALLERVQFARVSPLVVISAHTGSAWCVTGTASFSANARNSLLYYHRLAPCGCTAAENELVQQLAAPPLQHATRTSAARTRRISDTAASQLLCLPVDCWLRLQCRAVLNAAVFPRLTILTAGRCLESLYQYVLCETEGRVEASEQQRRSFEDGYMALAKDEANECHLYHSVLNHPLSARSTNAIFALQPHLPDGFLKLPFSVLVAAPSNDHYSQPSSILSSSSSSPVFLHSATQPKLLVAALGGSVELLRHCADYLDTNSLLFGLLPAVHSLPSLATAFTSSACAHRVLVDRYGRWSDAGLWRCELLTKWRVDGFEQQRTYIKRHTDAYRSQKQITRRCAELDEEQSGALQRDVPWTASHDLQTRINRYLIRVMLQRKEDVLPQIYHPPPTIIPTPTTRPPHLSACLPWHCSAGVSDTTERCAEAAAVCAAHPFFAGKCGR